MKTKGTPVSKVVKTTKPMLGKQVGKVGNTSSTLTKTVKPMLGKQVGKVEDFTSTSGKKLGTLTKTYKSVSVKKS